MQYTTQRISGVFPHLVNQAAFVDTIWIGLRGQRRDKILRHIKTGKNRAIGGVGRAYARCIPGRNRITGNQMQFRYGTLRPYGNFSPFGLTLWADRLPVTCADVMLTADGLMRSGHRARVSLVELTFDTSGIPLDKFGWELCTTARMIREFEGSDGTTIYIGGTNSSWRFKLYQKTDSVVRLEFTLRRRFLAQHGILKLEDLALLRKASLWNHLCFRRVDQSDGDSLPARIRKHWQKLGHGVPPHMPSCIVQKLLRESHINPSHWVIESKRQTLLRKMLSNFVW